MGMFDIFKKKVVEVKCPSCGALFVKAPKSKTKCKSCGSVVFVRTHYLTGELQYLLERQKIFYDLEKTQFYFEKSWLKRLTDLGINDGDVSIVREELHKKWGGNNPSFNDLMWAMFNRQVIRLGKNGASWHDLKMLYLTWGLFAYEINSDPTNLLQQSHLFELKSYERGGYAKEVEVLANSGCEECSKLNGKRYKLADLMKNNEVLPNKLCSHGKDGKYKFAWCRCMFLPVIEGLSK